MRTIGLYGTVGGGGGGIVLRVGGAGLLNWPGNDIDTEEEEDDGRERETDSRVGDGLDENMLLPFRDIGIDSTLDRVNG